MLHLNIKKFRTNLDILGMGASILCAIHCSILPILLGFGVFNSLLWMQSSWVEALILFISVFLASYSLWSSYKKHGVLIPLLVSLAGFFAFALGHLFEENEWHMILSTSGGILIAIAHLINFRLVPRACSVS